MTLQIIAIILALNVVATVSLWREAVQRPSKPSKKFLNALFDSKPITPTRKAPEAIGKNFPSLVTDSDRLFFHDFSEFGHVVNWWFADEPDGSPWRLQELFDTELSLDFSDTPDFGRRYEIFHNQTRLGTLEISANHKYTTASPIVRTRIDLDFVRFLSFDRVRDFLLEIAMHVSDNADEAEKIQATQAIDRSLMRIVWQSQEISGWARWGLDESDWGAELSVRIDGTATWYLTRRDALRRKESGEVEASEFDRFFTSGPTL